MKEETKEPQYQTCVEIKNKVGLQSLGLMTNQVYYDDPRRLTFLLSRYKFVSKIMSGKDQVAELGCGDAFGTRVVQQEVGSVTAYDFDPVFVEDIKQRQVSKWALEAHVHNILDGPLPRGRYNGVYSLDVMEHIIPEQEHLYLQHIAQSLEDDGVFVVGMPSIESQEYASPPSKAGHVNCKTGKDLKKVLEKYYENVFIFSMNDEVVHTGFLPMAHYIIGLCCGPKRDKK
ncbi:class I SAM-dependent methyltransferase [Thalassospira xiamenensis]|nr:class I SAM-dependent methyltransferase [Thalassospira xiamenensis]MCD1595234.1 class I SAM-dependent methyltransferase [Thalassospira xiamenensis]